MNKTTDCKPICYIDLDDTLANFSAAYMVAIHKNSGIKYPQSQLKFFENLEPVYGAIDAYNELKKHYNIKILTAPSVYNPLSYMEKRLWVEKHLGFAECHNLIIAQDKTLLKGRYLIDDFPQYGLIDIPEWEHIVFKSPVFPDWESVVSYLIQQIR